MTVMTAGVLDRPGTSPGQPPASADDDPYEHLYCCDPDVALCGIDLSDYDEDPDSEDPVCPLCATAEAEGFPCAVKGCAGD